jgi:hypothetical protein
MLGQQVQLGMGDDLSTLVHTRDEVTAITRAFCVGAQLVLV